MRNPRVLIAGGVVLASVAVGGVALSLGGGSGGGDDRDRALPVARAKLTLERFTPPGAAGPELLVSLSVPRLNTLAVTGGARTVTLRCVDAEGRTAITRPADWPLLEETGYAPHIHQPAIPRLLDSIRACRLTGPGIDFEGRVAGRAPAAQ